MSKNTLNAAVFIAILAGLVGCVADTLLLYSPDGGYMDGTYHFLKGISAERMLWGHYLGTVAIPMEALGLVLIWQALAPAGTFIRQSAVVLGLFLFFPGLIYHGSVFAIWEAVHHSPASLPTLQAFNEPLGAVLAGGFFLLFLSLIGLILSGKTHFRKWLVLFAPPVVYSLMIAFLWIYPPLGNLLAPMGFNLSMAIFYFAAWRAYHPKNQ